MSVDTQKTSAASDELASQPCYAGSHCSFVPDYVLRNIANSDQASEQTRQAARDALGLSQGIRQQRTADVNQAFGVKLRSALPQDKKREVWDYGKNAVVRSEGQADSTDRQVNDVYDGLGIVYDFLKKVFGRNGPDNLNSPMVASVHHFGNNWNNAHFEFATRKLAFGDGDGREFTYFSGSLDVIAHELTHWLIFSSAKLNYVNQSGALNESISDAFACMIEQYQFNQKVEDGDWLVGQTIRPVGRRAPALRSMKNPGSAYDDPVLGKDPQPKHMNQYKVSTADQAGDWGGVHTNSGIPNYAFYLIAMALGGYVWEKTGRIWYDAITDPSIDPNCTFAQFARLTVDKSRAYGDAVKNVVEDAWVRVGVLEAPRPPPAPSGPCPPVYCDRCGAQNIGARCHLHCLICNRGDYDICQNCYKSSPVCLDISHSMQARKYVPGSPSWTLQIGCFCDYCDVQIITGGYKCYVCRYGSRDSCANCVSKGAGCPHSKR